MLRKETLNNGVRVVTENIPNVRSVSIGIWVGTGSRNETPENNGVSHFIEHMMFKGTKKRTSRQIAVVMDKIGGQINAFTSKETTCYYTKTLDSHYKIAVDLLADIFFNSTFAQKNIKIEKGVIIEEIGMYEDSLEELVHDLLSETIWKGSSLGYPILGTYESLNNINRDLIIEYYTRRYTPKNVVISVAGSFDYEKMLGTLRQYFETWTANEDNDNFSDSPKFNRDVTLKAKDSEQTHISIGLPGIEYGNDDLYSLLAVNNIFGGSMSSRLFQRIREKKGLSYSIYSYPSSYSKVGMFSIYAALNPDNISEVIKLIVEEIVRLRDKKLSVEEINRAKEQLKGSYILGLEGTGNRMTAIGKSELLLGRIFSPDEILEKINNINKESVDKVIDKVFNTDALSLAVVGKIRKDIDFNSLIKAN